MPYPAEYRYTKEHEWVAVDGTSASIGITDYAQSQLGDIVFVELPKVGATLEAHAIFGSIESVKSVSDLFCPVTGTVTEINDSLGSAPETINAGANTTWIMKLTLADPAQLDSLLSAADYEAFIAEEGAH